MTTETFQEFLGALGQRESSGEYYAKNDSYWGMWQLGQSALDDIGFMSGSSWVGKDGINSLNDFLAGANAMAAQNDAINLWMNQLDTYINAYHLSAYDGQVLGGVTITMSGMLAGAHLVGIGGLLSY